MLLTLFHQWKPVQDQVSSNGGERVCMSGTCDILDTTVGRQEHTLPAQEPAQTYWVTLKISSSMYFISVTDGGRKRAAGKLFLLWDRRLFTDGSAAQGRRTLFVLLSTSPARQCLLQGFSASEVLWGLRYGHPLNHVWYSTSTLSYKSAALYCEFSIYFFCMSFHWSKPSINVWPSAADFR